MGFVMGGWWGCGALAPSYPFDPPSALPLEFPTANSSVPLEFSVILDKIPWFLSRIWTVCLAVPGGVS